VEVEVMFRTRRSVEVEVDVSVSVRVDVWFETVVTVDMPSEVTVTVAVEVTPVRGSVTVVAEMLVKVWEAGEAPESMSPSTRTKATRAITTKTSASWRVVLPFRLN
jgi:hypothetical protein